MQVHSNIASVARVAQEKGGNAEVCKLVGMWAIGVEALAAVVEISARGRAVR